jgi:uncharacterized delta-60 repeat protein
VKKFVFVLVAILFAVILPVQATAPGEPDVTFGTGGFLFTATPNGINGQIVTVDSWWRIIVAGQTPRAKGVAVVRFTPQGELDTSFGVEGWAEFNIGGDVHTVNELILDTQGRILIAGMSMPGNTYMARLLENGELDITFNASGFTLLTATHIAGLAIDDGKIVTSVIVNNKSGVARLNSDGTLDSTFGQHGYAFTTFASSGHNIPHEVFVHADGKILVVNQVSLDGYQDYPRLVRFNNDGSLDTSFGDGGNVSDSSLLAAIFTAAIDANGKIVVAGMTSGDTNSTDGFLARYNPDGSLDTTFGTQGTTTVDVHSGDHFVDLVMDTNGRIIAIGGTGDFPQHDFFIARFSSDGILDSSFGMQGVEIHNFGNNEAFISVALQDDNIIALGTSASGTMLAR